MKRFIPHEELARDSRFVRQDPTQATVLASMPDDVDTIVNVFEQFGPMIEAGSGHGHVLFDHGRPFPLERQLQALLQHQEVLTQGPGGRRRPNR